MKKTHWILWSLILTKFILQYSLIDPVYDLHRDEFLHLDQGRHLAWGYTSVPPVTSWISYLIILLGNSTFWVKFFPALFGAITIWLVWKTIEELNGNWFALTLGGISVLFSVLLRINTLYQPNSLDILSWTLVYYVLIKFINTENRKWLYVAAVVFAVGFLNKYNIAFLILGLIPAILITEHRRIFLNKQLYFAALLAIILISPNLIWQYLNDFPVVHHLKELSATQLVNVNRLDFLKEQILFFFNSVFVILAAFIALAKSPIFRKFRFVGWSFLFTMALFTWFRAKAYYAIGLYPILLAFGAVYLEQLLTGKWGKYVRMAVLLLPILLFYPIFKIGFPNRTPKEIRQNIKMYQDFGLLRWEDGKDHSLPQDFADMLCWKELAHKVDSAYNQIARPDQTLVYCDNYGQAGAINYYSKIKNIGAVSLNADYINWFRLDKEIRYIIRVKEFSDHGKELIVSKPYCDTVIRFDAITNELAREYGTTVYLLMNTKVRANELLQKEIDEQKKRY